MKNLGQKVARSSACFLLLLTLLLSSMTVQANEETGPPAQEAIKTFTENYFKTALENHHVPGIAISYFKDDSIIYSAGFGYIDIENQVPVSPTTSVFRVGSITKLLPMIGLLQQREAGKINLMADITSYTEEFGPLSEFETPVTAHHLLSHTDGFGTRDLGTFFKDETEIVPLEEVLKKELKSPVYSAGNYVTYGDYGTAIAGRLVEILSGKDFNTYATEEIFEPLGMTYSIFAQKEETSSNYAITYDYDAITNSYKPLPYYYLQTPPTSGMRTTAIDMAKLAIAITNNGTYEDGSILTRGSTQMMLNTQFLPNEGLGGVTYGFMESYQGGQRL